MQKIQQNERRLYIMNEGNILDTLSGKEPVKVEVKHIIKLDPVVIGIVIIIAFVVLVSKFSKK